eukprot:COSAG06_NODE_63446_length_262_cov_0.638037_1_plen_33_part_10
MHNCDACNATKHTGGFSSIISSSSVISSSVVSS